MQRRNVLQWATAALAVLGAGSWYAASRANDQTKSLTKSPESANTDTMTTIDLSTLEKNPATVTAIEVDDAQWKQLLSDASYRVLRKEGTERPFTSPLNDEKRAGEYVCAGCGLALFKSDTKYDSGTGWPSFFDKIEGRLGTKTDFKIGYPRTEYHCARCGGHQGHVFKDGPKPTGLRYCNNGVALRFIPSDSSTQS